MRLVWMLLVLAAALTACSSQANADTAAARACPFPLGSVAEEPFLVVDVPSPSPSAQVLLHGCASVDEGDLDWVLVDGAGHVLADGQVAAWCGTGCVAGFTIEVPADVARTTVGAIEVFASSRHGVLAHLARVPVVLASRPGPDAV